MELNSGIRLRVPAEGSALIGIFLVLRLPGSGEEERGNHDRDQRVPILPNVQLESGIYQPHQASNQPDPENC